MAIFGQDVFWDFDTFSWAVSEFCRLYLLAGRCFSVDVLSFNRQHLSSKAVFFGVASEYFSVQTQVGSFCWLRADNARCDNSWHSNGLLHWRTNHKDIEVTWIDCLSGIIGFFGGKKLGGYGCGGYSRVSTILFAKQQIKKLQIDNARIFTLVLKFKMKNLKVICLRCTGSD
jgi:hypothetical protein